MLTAFFLIGPPGSGKSTWRNRYLEDYPNNNISVISTDDMIDAYAKEHNLTYTEAFKKSPLKDFEKLAFELTDKAISEKKDIIIDRTNMSVKVRSKFLSRIPDTYKKIAIVFSIPREELNKRLEKRAKETGKFISPTIIDSMLNSYIAPSLEEGFNKIAVVKHA